MTIITHEMSKVLEVGKINWWSFYRWDNRWELEPLNDSPLKPVVVKRIEALKNVGVKIKRIYIAHEPTPAWLPAKVREMPEIKLPEINLPWKEIGRAALTVGTVAVIGTAIMSALATALPIIAVMAVLAILDPVYVIELSDGSLIEIYSEPGQ